MQEKENSKKKMQTAPFHQIVLHFSIAGRLFATFSEYRQLEAMARLAVLMTGKPLNQLLSKGFLYG